MSVQSTYTCDRCKKTTGLNEDGSIMRAGPREWVTFKRYDLCTECAEHVTAWIVMGDAL